MSGRHRLHKPAPFPLAHLVWALVVVLAVTMGALVVQYQAELHNPDAVPSEYWCYKGCDNGIDLNR